MTTAVISPPSFQPLPRWNTNNAGQGGLNAMSADEVGRIFMPRKSAQRTNSSSSLASSSSSSSTFTIPVAPPSANGESAGINGDQSGWGPRKKNTKGFWPSSKAEAVSGLSTARSQTTPTPSSGQSAASTMSAIHQPASAASSASRSQPLAQQNNARSDATSSQPEPQAILALIPMTGTFERKQIVVPYFPEVLRIGRQTNPKTVPTPMNGYFDSKVLSRQHAEVWADQSGKIWIRDVKSSNGTFVNGNRLSPENRDSEPHELREHDTLELGIDIVSEDQKSIVHHKVSAKVEHAGVYGNGSQYLDLNFGEIDPASRNGLLGPSVNQQISHLRGRSASQGSIGGNGRLQGLPNITGGNLNAIGAQRHMNHWMNPITIEQVVKRLTMELKQAKQQSQELHRTGDFFSTLMAPGLRHQPLDSNIDDSRQPSQANNSLPITQNKSILPFSQPPAPPPQQPLPENPDVAHPVAPTSLLTNALKRVDTEKPLSALASQTKSEPSVISLVEALTTAKREIDLQSDRVKHLETLLQRERQARESAEERARCLLEDYPAQESIHENGTVEVDAFKPTAKSSIEEKSHLTNGYTNGVDAENLNKHIPRTPLSLVNGDSQHHKESNIVIESVDTSTSRLQEKLELMAREMDEMKITMETYKRRAEGAESERKSLAEMVERIRAGVASRSTNLHGESSTIAGSRGRSADLDSHSPLRPGSSSDRRASASSASGSLVQQETTSYQILPSGDSINRKVETIQQTLSAALQDSRSQQRTWHDVQGDVAVQSAPYISMVGVVLIGVGIMTWLNGWQKVDR